MIRKPVVFISSTSELKAEREAVAQTLRPDLEPFLYEEHAAASGTPRQVCQRWLELSDCFVALVGPRYGSMCPGETPERSICEWEYDVARAQRGCERMVFIQEPPAETVEQRQQQFIKRLRGDFQTGEWCKNFQSSKDLVVDVLQAVVHWQNQFWQPLQHESNRRVNVWLLFALLPLNLLALGLGFWAVFLVPKLLPAMVVAALLTVALVPLLSWALLKSQSKC